MWGRDQGTGSCGSGIDLRRSLQTDLSVVPQNSSKGVNLNKWIRVDSATSAAAAAAAVRGLRVAQSSY